MNNKLEKEIDRIILDNWDDSDGSISLSKASAALSQLLTKAEKNAQLEILRGFRRRDFVRDDMYEVAVLDRIAELNKTLEEEK